METTTRTGSGVSKENDRLESSDSSTDDDTNNNAEGDIGSRNRNPKKSHGPGRSDLNRLKKRERKARKEQSRQGGQQGSGCSETRTVGDKSDGKNHDEYKEVKYVKVLPFYFFLAHLIDIISVNFNVIKFSYLQQIRQKSLGTLIVTRCSLIVNII